MARLKADGALAVFVGDGLSDRYAAASADLVFAKHTLAAHCESAAIPYTPYDTLAAVADGLERWLRRGVPSPRSGKGAPVV